MFISKIAVNKPVTFLIIFIIVILLGLYTTFFIPIDLYPQLEIPVLFVMTDYNGAGPEEVEKRVTRLLESALSNVGNIDKISSISMENYSQIILEFKGGTDIAEASNSVRDRIEYIKKGLPEEAQTPMIFKFDPSMAPIMYMAIRGNRTPEELRKIGENIVQPRLEQVEGVALANVVGGRERAIRVEIPENRLQAYNITLTQIANMLSIQNVQISAGNITQGNKNILIRTSGEYKDIEEIKDTVITYKGSSQDYLTNNINPGKVVRLRDIANVYDGLKKEEDAAFVNGEPAVQIIVQKQSGTNSVRTADNVIYRLYRENKVVKSIKNFMSVLGIDIPTVPKSGSLINELPPDIKLDIIYDSTKLIRQSLSSVAGTVLSGALLAIIILFLFLRSLKSVIIIGLSIPISVIITLLLMYFTGFTLNIMTLAGLALGIGMLVDNSIVILDNIYRYREKGAKLTTASILGSQEMVTAIVASTLTTICVFAPLLMFKNELGIYGDMFSGFAFTVVFSLSSSLLVAIFLVPVLSSRYLPIASRLETRLTGFTKKFDDTMEYLIKDILEENYKKAISFVLHHRKITILIIAAVFISSILFVVFIPAFQLFPSSDEDHVRLSLELPIGTKLEVTKNVCAQFEQIIKKEIKGYKSIITRSGEKSFFGFLGSPQSHKGTILIILEDNPSKRGGFTSRTIQEKLRKYFNEFPSVTFSYDSGGGRMFGGGASPIDILVKSDNLTLAKNTAEKILEMLKDEKKVPEVSEPAIDLKEGLPQLELVVDRKKAYSLGLNIITIGNEIKASIDGVVATKFREEGDEYDVLVILDEKDRNEIPDLERIFVINNQGIKIPLSSVAIIPDESQGPIQINRENQKRTVHVTANVKRFIQEDGKRKIVNLNNVEFKLRKLIKSEIPLEEDLVIDFSGDFADLMEYGQKLLFILLVAVILVFGVMASQFESFLDPFIIMFTMPLTFTGVIWIYYLTFEKFNLVTIVGIIVLMGVVVNNGIVLVDYTNLMVKRGLSIIDACIEAGRHRLRPVLMTTLTTVLGLIPTAFIRIESADMSRIIAKTILGGLTVSTVFTLFLVPVIYSVFNEFSQKLKNKKIMKREKELQIRKEKLSMTKAR